jgi:GNAT superfamily N-acetyltransferase
MQDDKHSFIAEIEVGSSYASLMSATSLFFTGILISQYKSFNATIKVPLIYLIISTFSFIFAATIYGNAGTEITLNKMRAVEKYMIYAKNVVELLGLYLFVLAVPLVIGAVTQDSFLRSATIIIAIVGFAIYSQSTFSILEKELSLQKKRLLSTAIVILALLLYYEQSKAVGHSLVMYSAVSIVLLLVIVAATVTFSFKSKRYKPVIVRAFRPDDAEHVAALIAKNNHAGNASPDAPASRSLASPDAVKVRAEHEQIVIAKFDHKVVGFACLKSNIISTIYTDATTRRKGIGRTLVERLESKVSEAGFREIKAYAEPHEHSFYKRLGYEDIEEIKNDHGTSVMLMQKEVYGHLN